MTTAKSIAGHRVVRTLVGVAISLGFLWLTVSRIDLGGTARALVSASPLFLALALVFCALEVALRSLRWQLLLLPLRPSARVRYRSALAYECIGYFTNSLLPMRMGDVVRAYLAGRAFGVPRLATLGTVLIERLADGFAILGLAFVLGLLVAGGGTIAETAAIILVLGVGASGVLAALWRARGRLLQLADRTAFGSRLEEGIGAVVSGGAALRSIGGAATMLGLTFAVFLSTVLSLVAVATATGLGLSPLQAGFVAAAIALSTAIPAAPGSLGTYEFVGSGALIALGFPAEPALAAVVLVHGIAVLPTSAAGLVATWALELRVRSFAEGGVAEAAPELAR